MFYSLASPRNTAVAKRDQLLPVGRSKSTTSRSAQRNAASGAAAGVAQRPFPSLCPLAAQLWTTYFHNGIREGNTNIYC